MVTVAQTHNTSICVPGKKRSGASLKDSRPTFFGHGDSLGPPTTFICRPRASFDSVAASSASALPISRRNASIKGCDRSSTLAACRKRSSNGTFAVRLSNSC